MASNYTRQKPLPPRDWLLRDVRPLLQMHFRDKQPPLLWNHWAFEPSDH
jgi:hypothetical protein